MWRMGAWRVEESPDSGGIMTGQESTFPMMNLLGLTTTDCSGESENWRRIGELAENGKVERFVLDMTDDETPREMNVS
jgi:hypothetical protein